MLTYLIWKIKWENKRSFMKKKLKKLKKINIKSKLNWVKRKKLIMNWKTQSLRFKNKIENSKKVWKNCKAPWSQRHYNLEQTEIFQRIQAKLVSVTIQVLAVDQPFLLLTEHSNTQTIIWMFQQYPQVSLSR